ncbi:MAG: hypothetical protein AB7U59_14910 [Desulfovibrionaceae bacterium]
MAKYLTKAVGLAFVLVMGIGFGLMVQAMKVDRVTAQRDQLIEHLADLEGLAGRLDRIEVALTGGACPVTEARR